MNKEWHELMNFGLLLASIQRYFLIPINLPEVIQNSIVSFIQILKCLLIELQGMKEKGLIDQFYEFVENYGKKIQRDFGMIWRN